MIDENNEKQKNEKKKFALPKITGRDVAYILTIIFMLLSLHVTLGAKYSEFANRDSRGKGIFGWVADRVADLTIGQVIVVKDVFTWEGSAALFAVVLYSFVLIRNKRTLYQFNHIDIRNVIIHFLNLLFLTSVFAAFITRGEVFGLSAATYMIFAIIFTVISMKTLSGYGWILSTIAIINNIEGFNKWGYNGVVYIISAYISFVIQVLILKMWEFDLISLKNDFLGTQIVISENVKKSIETTKTGVAATISTAATIATKVPIAGLNNEKITDNSSNDSIKND